jgi:drug/metabolite transporter (DMT)-like permease
VRLLSDGDIVVTSSASRVRAAPRFDRRQLGCLAAVYVIWGSTYLAARVAMTDLPPLAMASMRCIAAGAAMLGVARYLGAALPSARDWLRAAPAGMLLFVGGNGFVALAETRVSSGGAAVVCALVPLWVAVLGTITGKRPTAREWLALVVGFTGVVVLMRSPSLAGEPWHIALLACAPLAWAGGSILATRTRTTVRHAALVVAAIQLITGGVGLALASAAFGEHIPAHVEANSWFALAYLIVFGSLIAFTAYSWLIANVRPAVATSYAYVNPVVAVLLGAAFRHEPIGVSTVIANLMVAIALVLAVPARKPRHSERAAAS